MKSRNGIILVAALIGGCATTEYISHRRVNPAGRIFNLRDCLAWRPSDDRFAAVTANGNPQVIAYGPSDSWILMSSGPSAYVVDNQNRLVDWSSDIGDAPAVVQKWGTDKSQPVSRTEVQKSACDKK